eukprot:1486492-Pleurochrysis_carterae.AAC.1
MTVCVVRSPRTDLSPIRIGLKSNLYKVKPAHRGGRIGLEQRIRYRASTLDSNPRRVGAGSIDGFARDDRLPAGAGEKRTAGSRKQVPRSRDGLLQKVGARRNQYVCIAGAAAEA